jgi:hypothetical protein
MRHRAPATLNSRIGDGLAVADRLFATIVARLRPVAAPATVAAAAAVPQADAEDPSGKDRPTTDGQPVT